MRTRLLLALLLAGGGLATGATGAYAAAPGPARTTAALSSDINGPWTDDGRPGILC